MKKVSFKNLKHDSFFLPKALYSEFKVFVDPSSSSVKYYLNGQFEKSKKSLTIFSKQYQSDRQITQHLFLLVQE